MICPVTESQEHCDHKTPDKDRRCCFCGTYESERPLFRPRLRLAFSRVGLADSRERAVFPPWNQPAG